MEFRITWTYLVPHRNLSNHIAAFIKYINTTDEYLHSTLFQYRSVIDISFVAHCDSVEAILNATHHKYNATLLYHMTDYQHYNDFQEYCTFVAHLLDTYDT